MGCTQHPPFPETENEQRAAAPARAVTPRDETGALIVLSNDLCQVRHFSAQVLVSYLMEPVKELKRNPERALQQIARVESGEVTLV